MHVVPGHGIFAAPNSTLVFPDDETSSLRISAFAGKRCIVDRLPLPPCCDNPYCAAHLSKPTRDGQNVAAKDNLRQAALKIVFARHDKNSSGEGLYGKPQPPPPPCYKRSTKGYAVIRFDGESEEVVITTHPRRERTTNIIDS